MEAVADLSRAVEMSDASPASLHYLAKALKVATHRREFDFSSKIMLEHIRTPFHGDDHCRVGKYSGASAFT